MYLDEAELFDWGWKGWAERGSGNLRHRVILQETFERWIPIKGGNSEIAESYDEQFAITTHEEKRENCDTGVIEVVSFWAEVRRWEDETGVVVHSCATFNEATAKHLELAASIIARLDEQDAVLHAGGSNMFNEGVL